MARLGIHTLVNTDQPETSHAWITLDEDGQQQESYALYPNTDKYSDYERLYDSDIIIGAHPDTQPTTSLYAELSPQQEDNFQYWFHQQVELIEPHFVPSCSNSAHWAANSWEAATGKFLEVPVPSGGLMPVTNVVELEQSLRSLELKPEQERIVAPELEKTPDASACRSQIEPSPQTVSMIRKDIDYGYNHDR